MDHVAIDLGGRKSQICVRRSDGEVVEECKLPTLALVGYLSRRAPSVVSMETCAEAFSIATAARKQGHQVRVVPASLVKSLGVGSRGVKNDRRDAQMLSAASCRMAETLPSVHIPSEPSRQRKAMVGMRDTLVQSRTRHINVVRGWMRAEARQLPTGTAETFAKRVRELAKTQGFEVPPYVELQLAMVETLSGSIAKADKEIEEVVKREPRCQTLRTMPGMGPITSLMFVAVLDQVERFPSAHLFESYLGLVPGEDSSSERERRTRITKAGSSSLRRLLVQSAHVMRRCRPNEPLVQWSVQVEKRRGKRVAVVALARKMAGIGWALLRTGKPYDPSRAAQPPTPTEAQRMDEALALLSSSSPAAQPTVRKAAKVSSQHKVRAAKAPSSTT